LFGGICLSLSLVAATALIPGVKEIFRCVPISGYHWLIITSMSILPFFVIELKKWIMRRKGLMVGGAA